MAEVNIVINGRAYDIACDDGQEGRIVDLAHYIDQKVQAIARSGAAFNDSHVLVLAALVLADELFDAKAAAISAQKAARAASASAQPAQPAISKADEQALARVLDQLVQRIDGIAQRVRAA